MAEADDLTDAQRAAWQALCRAWDGAESFQVLPSPVVYRRAGHMPAAGWRTHLPTDYLGRDRTLDILLTRDFPIEPPQMWIDPNPFLAWPHAESNGHLCLWPEEGRPVGLTPSEWIARSIERFRRVFSFVGSHSDPEARAREFAVEWTSYWHHPKEPGTRSAGIVLMLSMPPEPSGLFVRAVRAPRFEVQGQTPRSMAFLVCDRDPDRLDAWIRHSGLAALDMENARALWLPLHAAPSDPGAPVTLDEIRAFILKWALDSRIALDRFEDLLADSSASPRWLVFGHGDSTLVGLRVKPTYSTPNFHGHQNRKTRDNARKQRRRQGFRIEVAEAQRADPPWLQERNRNPRHHRLLQSHITIIGAGSLGSMVAEGLAMAGVGRLTLVDPGILETANLGRHALGVASVGQNKAFALRSRLLGDYPHLEIEAIDKAAQDAPESLAGDLVICTSANPACEAFLIQRLDDGALSSLMLAWSEPHALAGHSAHSAGSPTVLQALFREGRCTEPATEWPKSQSVPLPGCGASHLPGAGNRVRLIAALVVEHAVDVIIGDTGIAEHRLWVAASAIVESLGGRRLLPSPAGEAAAVRRPIPEKLTSTESLAI